MTHCGQATGGAGAPPPGPQSPGLPACEERPSVLGHRLLHRGWENLRTSYAVQLIASRLRECSLDVHDGCGWLKELSCGATCAAASVDQQQPKPGLQYTSRPPRLRGVTANSMSLTLPLQQKRLVELILAGLTAGAAAQGARPPSPIDTPQSLVDACRRPTCSRAQILALRPSLVVA
jgi:hypothetical protein